MPYTQQQGVLTCSESHALNSTHYAEGCTAVRLTLLCAKPNFAPWKLTSMRRHGSSCSKQGRCTRVLSETWESLFVQMIGLLRRAMPLLLRQACLKTYYLVTQPPPAAAARHSTGAMPAPRLSGCTQGVFPEKIKKAPAVQPDDLGHKVPLLTVCSHSYCLPPCTAAVKVL